MNHSKRTIVFDLDGTLETPYFKESQAGAVQTWMGAHDCGYGYDWFKNEITCGGERWNIPIRKDA